MAKFEHLVVFAEKGLIWFFGAVSMLLGLLFISPSFSSTDELNIASIISIMTGASCVLLGLSLYKGEH